MSDIDLIYGACLRAERKLSAEVDRLLAIHSPHADAVASNVSASLRAINALREEIGADLAKLHTENRP